VWNREEDIPSEVPGFYGQGLEKPVVAGFTKLIFNYRQTADILHWQQ